MKEKLAADLKSTLSKGKETVLGLFIAGQFVERQFVAKTKRRGQNAAMFYCTTYLCTID
jgi:hypothetical protein